MVARRKAKSKKIAEQRIPPSKIKHLVVLLENLYWNGFMSRASNYRIGRSNLRELLNIRHLDSETIKMIIDSMRKSGFVLYPLDSCDDTAKEWIVERIAIIQKYPLADQYAFQRAEDSRHSPVF